MNKLADYILEPDSQLYRYDIVQPPKEWGTDFKNPEYIYSDTGAKNQFGAFFFFNSFEYAYNTAICALGKNKEKADGIWITKCTIEESVKLLDLRDFVLCVELLSVLDRTGYGIFCDEFKTWKGIPLSKLLPVLRPIEDILLNSNDAYANVTVREAVLEIQKILEIQNDHIGYLLQLFTDYSNGVYFRKLLQDNGYEGYIFNETNSFCPIPGSDTICVFKSIKFQPPHIEFTLNEKEAGASLDNLR